VSRVMKGWRMSQPQMIPNGRAATSGTTLAPRARQAAARSISPRHRSGASFTCSRMKVVVSPVSAARRPIQSSSVAVTPWSSWGTSPEHAVPIDAAIPDPRRAADAVKATEIAAALDYMGLAPGWPIAGIKVDRVFIGSCTNSRLPDLREAAGVVRGRKVAPHVKAWVVPGSQRVKREAEGEGLDEVFRAAGFEWRESGCSMCVGANGDLVEPMARCVSTSNRNFVGRQGPQARTHLASPATAAAAAIAGEIADVRRL